MFLGVDGGGQTRCWDDHMTSQVTPLPTRPADREGGSMDALKVRHPQGTLPCIPLRGPRPVAGPTTAKLRPKKLLVPSDVNCKQQFGGC